MSSALIGTHAHKSSYQKHMLLATLFVTGLCGAAALILMFLSKSYRQTIVTFTGPSLAVSRHVLFVKPVQVVSFSSANPEATSSKVKVVSDSKDGTVLNTGDGFGSKFSGLISESGYIQRLGILDSDQLTSAIGSRSFSPPPVVFKLNDSFPEWGDIISSLQIELPRYLSWPSSFNQPPDSVFVKGTLVINPSGSTDFYLEHIYPANERLRKVIMSFIKSIRARHPNQTSVFLPYCLIIKPDSKSSFDIKSRTPISVEFFEPSK